MLLRHVEICKTYIPVLRGWLWKEKFILKVTFYMKRNLHIVRETNEKLKFTIWVQFPLHEPSPSPLKFFTAFKNLLTAEKIGV